jgi:hypothetical protein
MRGTSRLAVAAIAGSTLAACAALTGLDGITEDACAPHGCPDVAVAADAAGADAWRDDGQAVESGSGPEASASETGAGMDAPGADTSDGRDSAVDGQTEAGGDASTGSDAEGGPEGGADAEAGTGPEAGADAGADAEAGSGTDAGHADATSDGPPIVDAPADSPCGTVYVQESFDGNPPGWTLDSTWSIAPTCASPPVPQKGNPDPIVDHTTSAAGGVAAAYACGNNPTGKTSAARYATSPAVDTSSAPSLKLAFYRWLNSDAAGWMTSTVDVFDGSAWVNVYTNPSGSGNIVSDAAWTRVEYDVTAYKNAAFRVRFGYAITSTGVYSMSCWNVDDLTVSTISCP